MKSIPPITLKLYLNTKLDPFGTITLARDNRLYRISDTGDYKQVQLNGLIVLEIRPGTISATPYTRFPSYVSQEAMEIINQDLTELFPEFDSNIAIMKNKVKTQIDNALGL